MSLNKRFLYSVKLIPYSKTEMPLALQQIKEIHFKIFLLFKLKKERSV